MGKEKGFKVTYTTADPAGLEAFHQAYDKAIEDVSSLFGKSYSHYIAGEQVQSQEVFTDLNPTNQELLIGKFQKGEAAEFNSAVEAALAVFKTWRDQSFQQRCSIMRKAAEIIGQRKYELAAIMSLEAGKNRLEAMGDVEESADLIRYYCSQMEEAEGFVRTMGKLSPNEKAMGVLRPYGVWVVISPFNFPLALATGMSAGVLIAGNTAVFKPSSDTPLIGLKLYEIYKEAGIPDGVFNFITGPGGNFEETIFKNNKISGLVFTGSSEVGMSLYKGFSQDYPRPCILEMGSKNPAIVTQNADLDMAAEGVMKSAFGLGGQKCSACSRVYVHKKIEDFFLEKLLEKTSQIEIGDPAKRNVYLGPLINQRALEKFKTWAGICRQEGKILVGGKVLTEGSLAKGYFVEPTIVTGLPKGHKIFQEELFLPLLVEAPVDSLEEAVEECNKVDYGLTAGIFSSDQKEIEYFFKETESGVLYANRRSGATTGAWPGVQPFCGWKKSGSTGKGGCGPYYVAQFMREQSRTVME
ncbi:MAG: aldehyde dehydrogenase family protein [Candidatus Aminicenantes bacterium]|nr:aldehyde dehydrogenase family protein [Candidatus Aminicenantes bacterium]